MSVRVSWKAVAVTAIVVIVTLGGGYWAVNSYSRSQESIHQSKIDQLLSGIDDIHNQIDDLQNRIDSLQYRIHKASLKAAILRVRLLKLSPTELDVKWVNLSSARVWVPPETSLQAPQYQLPLETGEISNFQGFASKITLSDAALELLKRNGFVVIENPFNPREEYITRPYERLKDEEVPIFITSDSLLHLYHIQFAETLRTSST